MRAWEGNAVKRKRILVLLLVLVLVVSILVLTSCGEREGRRARRLLKRAGENTFEFMEGFCGAIILGPLCLGLASIVRRVP
jgi:hypothetical protein